MNQTEESEISTGEPSTRPLRNICGPRQFEEAHMMVREFLGAVHRTTTVFNDSRGHQKVCKISGKVVVSLRRIWLENRKVRGS